MLGDKELHSGTYKEFLPDSVEETDELPPAKYKGENGLILLQAERAMQQYLGYFLLHHARRKGFGSTFVGVFAQLADELGTVLVRDSTCQQILDQLKTPAFKYQPRGPQDDL